MSLFFFFTKYGIYIDIFKNKFIIFSFKPKSKTILFLKRKDVVLYRNIKQKKIIEDILIIYIIIIIKL